MQVVAAIGNVVDLETFKKGEITKVDIELGLARHPRFGGQLPDGKHYTVWDHTKAVAAIARAQVTIIHIQERVYGLGMAHDAVEAFTGDIPSPIKAEMTVGGKPFAEWEECVRARIERLVYGIEDVSRAERDVVARADRMVFEAEVCTFWRRELWDAFGVLGCTVLAEAAVRKQLKAKGGGNG